MQPSPNFGFQEGLALGQAASAFRRIRKRFRREFQESRRLSVNEPSPSRDGTSNWAADAAADSVECFAAASRDFNPVHILKRWANLCWAYGACDPEVSPGNVVKVRSCMEPTLPALSTDLVRKW